MQPTPPGPAVPAGSLSSAGVPGWYPGAPATVDEALASGRPLVAPRWGIPDAALAIVGSFVLAVLAAVGLALVPGVPSGLALLVGLLVPWLALAGWPIVATRWRGNGPIVDLGIRLRRTDLLWGLGGGLAALALGLVAGLITQALVGEFDSAAGDAAQELVDSGQRAWLVVFALLVAAGAPVVEELAFRGLLFAALAKRGIGPVLNVVITTAAFAVFHVEPTRIGVLVVIGAVLAVVRWRSRSVGAAMVAHAVNNLPGAIGLLLL